MKLSVIVPVYNEETNIAPFYERTRPVLESLPGLAGWEIIFVNNGSADGSLAELKRFRARDERVKIVTLSRNFGYHGALTAGLTHGTGELLAAIDVDCEDPPELFTTFLNAIKQGAQVAYGIRSNRDEFKVITLFRQAFYYLNQMVADSEVIVWMAEFCMMTRQVRDAILTPKTTYPFLRAEIGYVGFTRVGIPYRREARRRGRSHYNLLGMTRFAIGGILSSSTFPLRLVMYLAAALAIGFPLVALLARLSLEESAHWVAIVGFYFLLYSGSSLTLYLARTYKNGVARPVFIVDHQQTFLA